MYLAYQESEQTKKDHMAWYKAGNDPTKFKPQAPFFMPCHH